MSANDFLDDEQSESQALTALALVLRVAEWLEQPRQDRRVDHAFVAQRFGSLIQLNPHAHAVLADGVFVKQPDGTMSLVELGPPTQSELSAIGLAIAKAVVRVLARADSDEDDLASMQALYAAAIVATPATGHSRDRDDEHDSETRRSAKLATVIDSDLGRFSVHAGTVVANDDRAGLCGCSGTRLVPRWHNSACR